MQSADMHMYVQRNSKNNMCGNKVSVNDVLLCQKRGHLRLSTHAALREKNESS